VRAAVAGLLICLSSAAAAGQSDIVKIDVRRSVDRTAVWVGDTLRYTLEFSAPGDLDLLAEDLAKERLPIKGAEVLSVQSSERQSGNGHVRVVEFTLATYAVDTTEIVIDGFPVRYFSRRTVGGTQVAPAGQVVVPRTVIAIRSTLPDSGRLPDLREPRAIRQAPWYLRFAQPVGLALIALAIVPVALMLLDVAGHLRQLRLGAPRRKARRVHAGVLDELTASEPTSSQERRAAFDRLDHLVRDHLALTTGIPARALTSAEVAAALRARPGTTSAESIESLLSTCERARYAPNPVSDEAWRDAVSTAAGIVRRRTV
jgi:hypothetical protein